MNCESCGTETMLCMTVLDPDGNGRTMWLCDPCAIHAGAPISPGDTSPRAMIPRLRSLSEFISENGRFPSATEFDYSGSFPVLDDADVTPSVACRYFDDLINYISKHDRIPTDIELPDPF
ncbi:hypothetical protein V7x_56210 [Crateriforma conspicua]|uniref:Uncharacterized protein n=1 Tax=Crateriforma conspicua TaxID=2527996 RepID=A0A5C6FG80_9PLAN|nr:hypothetical protein V7x_56210 [Crateriforma conspicua]